MFENFLERSQENGPSAEKWQVDKESKTTRQRNERRETRKGNQMTALRRFQTGGWWFPSGSLTDRSTFITLLVIIMRILKLWVNGLYSPPKVVRIYINYTANTMCHVIHCVMSYQIVERQQSSSNAFKDTLHGITKKQYLYIQGPHTTENALPQCFNPLYSTPNQPWCSYLEKKKITSNTHTHTHTHTSQVTKSLRQVKVSTHLHFKSHDGIFMFEEALEDEWTGKADIRHAELYSWHPGSRKACKVYNISWPIPGLQERTFN